MRLQSCLLLLFPLVMACPKDTPVDSDTGVVDANDADGDTIMDIQEGEGDLDGDGEPNFRDTDTDGDGIKDRVEAGDGDVMTMPVDSDGDGIADFQDLDSDNNGVPDLDEKNATGDGSPGDTDGDGVFDFRDTDNDGDGIDDVTEIQHGGPVDSDADGTYDYLDVDSDGDGIGDVYEGGVTDWSDEPRDSDSDGTPDYLDLDSDGDGFSDASEGGVSDGVSEPADTDDDGHYDFCDTDSDGDSIDDAEESTYKTDPYDSDTDGDGESDGAEIAADTDPLDPTSNTGGTGLYVEVRERTEVEQEFQFELSLEKADIVFLLDTTGSMTGTANALASEFRTIVEELEATIEHAAYGFAHFEDYNYTGMGGAGVLPFALNQQVTADVDVMQLALEEVEIHSTSDETTDGIEAIYQGATGQGYDMDCDSTYDRTADVLPFIASSSDPFNGGGGESYDPATDEGGIIGGYGFREYSMPILVFGEDSNMRESLLGDRMPGGCPFDATMANAIDAINNIGGHFIGVDVGGGLVTPQMNELALGTNSVADTDGDGLDDDVLVFRWSGTDAEFRSTVVSAIEQLIGAMEFERVELQIEGDDYGFVQNIDPEYYDDIDPSDTGTVLTFTLSFLGTVAATTEDQVFTLTLNVIGDSTVLLDSYDILIVVPGTVY